MIRNERDYKNVRSDLAKFQKTMEYLEKAKSQGKISPRKIVIQQEATKSIMNTLKQELREYEQLKAGKYKIDFRFIDRLALHLIRARISLHWTQKDLANRVGTSEQQIQRYEATEYASASLTTIKRISSVMQHALGIVKRHC